MNPYLEALNLAITDLEDIVYLPEPPDREENKKRIERLKNMRDRAKAQENNS